MTVNVPKLGIRIVEESTQALALARIETSHDAAKVARALIGDMPQEHFIAIMLDGQNNVTGVTTLAIGSMHACAIGARDVLRAVILTHAAAFVVAHNHPSGDPTPSPKDERVTETIREAAKILGVVMLDHVIVTRTEAYRTVS